MKCPFCGSEEDKVIDSRSAQDGRAVRRRRECLSCSKRFTTYEYIENVALTVVKSDQRREPFERQKLIDGIRLACKKRPVSVKKIEAMANEVESVVQELSKSEVTSQKIGETVMEKLKGVDEVAYVRFASVYRKFQDKAEFFEELKKLLS
ncbi:MAG: transcriptional repressor NrdR [Candidatus Zixiibacteriota bacterium]|nr:MAG: transcriptional repressor NrdR [candidate division Zixibacteria bacterium]